MHAVEAYVNGYQGVSTYAIWKGFNDAGIPDNSVLIFSELMDSKSLFLTANADVVYFWPIIDLSNGPMVVETPPLSLGVIDDMWWRWVTDIGLPGPDRGAGGKYLLLPPGYTGEIPDSGYIVEKVRTTRVNMLGRAFLQDNSPKAAVELIKNTLKIYPYQPGGFGISIATALDGKVSLARDSKGSPGLVLPETAPARKFHRRQRQSDEHDSALATTPISRCSTKSCRESPLDHWTRKSWVPSRPSVSSKVSRSIPMRACGRFSPTRRLSGLPQGEPCFGVTASPKASLTIPVLRG